MVYFKCNIGLEGREKNVPFLLEKSKICLQFDQTIFGVPCWRKTITKPLTLPNATCINSPKSLLFGQITFTAKE